MADDGRWFDFQDHVREVMGAVYRVSRIGIQRGKERIEVHLFLPGIRDQLERLAQRRVRREAANEHPGDLTPRNDAVARCARLLFVALAEFQGCGLPHLWRMIVRDIYFRQERPGYLRYGARIYCSYL